MPTVRRALALPPFRIALAFLVVGLLVLPGAAAGTALGVVAAPYGWAAQITRAYLATATIAVLLLVDTRIERLRVQDLGFEPKSLPQLGGGFLIGLGMIIATLAVLVIAGWYRPAGWAVPVGRVPILLESMVLAFFLNAVFQEALFRGILFRGLESWLGSLPSLGITALLFGLLNAIQPHATILSTLAIGVGGGALLGAAYMATRNLWLAIGLHAAIDLVVLGISSAGPGVHLLRGATHGPPLWTGGGFGPTAGAVFLLISALVTLLLLFDAHRRGYIVALRGRAATGFETAEVAPLPDAPV